MTREEAVKEFKKIYLEPEIYVSAIKDMGNDNFVLQVEFSDGTFYFTVSKNTVSNAYDSLAKAVKSI